MDYEKSLQKSPKVAKKWYCEKCDYRTCKTGDWKKHLKTKKHNDYAMTTDDYTKVAKSSTENAPTSFECECGKKYSSRQNLYRHKKGCTFEPVKEDVKKTSPTTDEGSSSVIVRRAFTPEERREEMRQIIAENQALMRKQAAKEASTGSAREAELFEQNKMLVNQIIKVNDKLMEGAIGGGAVNQQQANNSNSFNTNNFNVQLFLSEQCKDAMSIQDYAQKLMITMEDLAKANKNKPEGITDIIFKNLTPLRVTDRPVHCTTEDRWFIKDRAEGWSEDTNKERLVSETQRGLQRKVQSVFDAEHPDWQTNQKLGEKYVETIGTVMGDISARDIKRVRDGAKDACSLDGPPKPQDSPAVDKPPDV